MCATSIEIVGRRAAASSDTRYKGAQFGTRPVIHGRGVEVTFSKPLRLFEVPGPSRRTFPPPQSSSGTIHTLGATPDSCDQGETYVTLTQHRNRERMMELKSQVCACIAALRSDFFPLGTELYGDTIGSALPTPGLWSSHTTTIMTPGIQSVSHTGFARALIIDALRRAARQGGVQAGEPRQDEHGTGHLPWALRRQDRVHRGWRVLAAEEIRRCVPLAPYGTIVPTATCIEMWPHEVRRCAALRFTP
jgi:hypothetical protein